MEAGAQETGAILPAFKGVPPFRNPFWASAYLMLLNYSAKRARDDISRMHLSYGEWLRGRVGPSARPLARDRNRSRMLRIGYLSGDLCDHVVADSVEGVLLGHNKDNVHVTCYQLQATTDAKTLRLKALSDRWQKHSEKAKACWGKVLLALPASQLLVKAKIFHSPADKKHWEDNFIETAMRGLNEEANQP